jgi:lysophospholipase L1-like esterase
VIELGGNDGLRGQPVATLRANLAEMIELSKASGARVLLAGIQIPPNYGQTYTRALAQLYPDLASAYDVALVEFLLDGVALDPNSKAATKFVVKEVREHPLRTLAIGAAVGAVVAAVIMLRHRSSDE